MDFLVLSLFNILMELRPLHQLVMVGAGVVFCFRISVPGGVVVATGAAIEFYASVLMKLLPEINLSGVDPGFALTLSMVVVNSGRVVSSVGMVVVVAILWRSGCRARSRCVEPE